MFRELRCALLRGGTSKGVFLDEADLPADAAERLRVVLAVFGSPDRRQVNGLGGGDPLTSKLALIGPGRGAADLTYTFGQVELERAAIDFASPCGNIVAAVGLHAVQRGLVRTQPDAPAPFAAVRIFNTNLRRIITVEVPVVDGRAIEHGDYVIPGVPGSGAKILVDFSDTAGAASGALLPTGRAREPMDVPGRGTIEVSLVDIANPHVFVRAADFGLAATESAEEIHRRPSLMDQLEHVRGLAALRFGLVDDPAKAREDSRVTPMVVIVGPPASYRSHPGGREIAAHEMDLAARLIFLERVHPTFAATSIACTGVAARLPGSIAGALARPVAPGAPIRIGHPAGVVEAEAEVDGTAGTPAVTRAAFGRTARRIMEGVVYVEA
ncbi:PrpF domain-containing protein [Xanthobacter sp. KR7-225]|uniref:PrpF domain-containing protein n=1 Tax=Xanthobacter sp. KR7-225 TaxID=3156613 RepID=UPI0032B5CE95